MTSEPGEFQTPSREQRIAEFKHVVGQVYNALDGLSDPLFLTQQRIVHEEDLESGRVLVSPEDYEAAMPLRSRFNRSFDPQVFGEDPSSSTNSSGTIEIPRKRYAPRVTRIGKLILDLMPEGSELGEDGNVSYPEERFEEIFSQGETKARVRTIRVLLDPRIAQVLLRAGDKDFSKFCEMLQQRQLPSLISDNEIRRIRYMYRLSGVGTTDDGDYVIRNLLESDYAMPVMLEPTFLESGWPARYVLYALYDKYKKGNLGEALEEINRLYPNETVPA